MSDTPPGTMTKHNRALREWALDLLIVAAFVAFVYHPLVFTHESLPADEKWTDLVSLAQPTYEYTGKTLAAGKLPLWNPYWFSGYPHLAMPSAGVFYPTTVLYGFLSFAIAAKLVAILHAFLTGAFSYALIRYVIGGRIPALYFALIAVMGDLVIVWVRNGQLWSLQTLAWFPLALLLIHRLCDKGRWGSVAGLAATIAMMVFGGDPQALAFCLWFLGPYIATLFAARFWKDRANWRPTLEQMALCASGFVLGMALAAIQLLPSRELFAESIRAHGLTYEYLSISAFPQLLEVFAWFEATGKDNLGMASAGRVVVVLAVVGLVFSRNLASWAAIAGSLACLLYILMPRWFYDAFVQYLPVYSGVRGAFRMCIMLWWAVAYWSAFGVAAWLSVRTQSRQRSSVAAVALAVLAIAVALPVWKQSPIATLQAVAWALAALGTIMVIVHRKLGRVWIAGIAAVLVAVTLELGSFAKTSNVSSDAAAMTVDSDFVKYSSARANWDRIAMVPRYQLRHGVSVGMMTGDRTLMGYHGLLLTNFARLFRDAAGVPVALMDEHGRLEAEDFAAPAKLEDYLTEKTLPLLEMFNVREIVVVGAATPLPEVLQQHAGLFTTSVVGKWRIYSNPRAMPQLFPIHEIVSSDSDEDALALIRDRRIDLRRQATISGEFDPSSVTPAVAPEAMAITEYAPERIAVSVELSAPAVLVFSEVFYPGWRATVDGSPREVLRVNTALRGVQVGAGKHEVVLTFAPDSFRRGAIISAGALIVLLGILGLAWRSRARVTPASTA